MKKKSLAQHVAIASATTVISFVAAHVLFEGLKEEGNVFRLLFMEHGWHLLVLGSLTYMTLYSLLTLRVAQPTEELYLKLYSITKGDRQPISVRTNIAEIQDLAEGINLLLARPERTPLVTVVSEPINSKSQTTESTCPA